MRTVTTETLRSPTICLAIDSPDASELVKAKLSQLGCRCRHLSDIASFKHLLDTETPHIVVVSLEFDGQCALQYCQDHPKLLGEIPVVFVATDPLDSFDKSLAAIRLGALDVLLPDFDTEKIENIASLAHERVRNWQIPAEAGFFVGGLHDGEQAPLVQEPVKLSIGDHESLFESTPDFKATENKGTHNVTSHPSQKVQGQSDSSSNRSFALPRHSTKPEYASGLSSQPCPQLLARKEAQSAHVKDLEAWILGSSPAMQEVRTVIAEVAETKANVMIYGASGTGKELVATALHKLSNRSQGPFEPVNMTEIPHDLAESLLFGHEKGSFTGADNRQIGVCEAANGGTLFLDEIGEMPLATQPKLLRFLQEGTVKRIGSLNAKKVDVRVITATNRNPDTIVKDGLMREDLFFRLHVVPIHMPALHERPEDIEQLATLFLRRYVKAYNRSVEGFTEEALDIFRSHDWPGNVRQLENVVERLVVFAKGRTIDVPDIPAEIHAATMFDGLPVNGFQPRLCRTLDDSETLAFAEQDSEAANTVASMSAIQRTERAAIIEALQRADGHVIDAANLLGLGQATVYRKIKQYCIPHQRRRRRRSPK